MTAEQARGLRDYLAGLVEREGTATRKVIANIPNEKRDYKPDPKARTAWELATHIAIEDKWFADSIVNGAFVWAGEQPVPPEMTDPKAVAAWHERHMADCLARLKAMSDDHLLRIVEFFGQKAPAIVWLGVMNNHTIHHRGQLATYLRPMGSKVPAIYGMSADENAMAG